MTKLDYKGHEITVNLYTGKATVENEHEPSNPFVFSSLKKAQQFVDGMLVPSEVTA